MSVTHSMPRIMRVIRRPVTERIVRVTRKPVSTVASAPVVGKPINEHRDLKFDPWKLRRELVRRAATPVAAAAYRCMGRGSFVDRPGR